LEWAGAFARREGAHIDLVHVLPEPTRDREELAADAATFEAARLGDARAELTRTAEAAARPAGGPGPPPNLRGGGDAHSGAHAGRHLARVIVVGASARPLVERWFLGSVADRTVRSATCPVVIVPRHESDQPWLSVTNDAAGRPIKILVGLEGADGGAELV